MSARKAVALIPARSGSKRVPGKNIRPLGGRPLIAYSIAAALGSGVFDAVVVSTDGEETAAVARAFGARVPFMRPAQYAGDLSPDIEWVDFTLRRLEEMGESYEFFSILRPTSPFRLPETIRRAFEAFRADGRADSLRAMEPCSQHPGKMWTVRGGRALPLLPFATDERPWHSLPYQALPPVFVQNASLEIAATRVVFDTKTIAGNTVMPFFTQGHEGFDINSPADWELAETLIATGRARLPDVHTDIP